MKGREAGEPARKNITETERMKKSPLSNMVSTIAMHLFVLVLPSAVIAAPLYDTFGPLDEATFGGTGIPNDEVAISSQFSNGESLITVAMSATQRYNNPALTNDGAGTYFAGAGSNIPPGTTDEGALWNFNYYINIDSTTETLADYDITIFYDFDTAYDNGPAGLGTIDVTSAILGGPAPTTTTLVEDSQNLMFNFLATGVPGIVDAPAGSFDPNALGEYNFGIEVSQSDWGVENVRMDVQVVPVPAAVWLFGSGLIGLVGIARRKQV
jgi:hypothetical protein